MNHLEEALPECMRWENIHALVGSLCSNSLVARVRNAHDCLEAIRFAQRNGLSICPKGGGYSYGDAILNSENVLLDTSQMNRIVGLDVTSAQVIVEPGVQLIDIQKLGLPHKLVLASVPSEPTITIAGAAAANVNGKDGWRVGNFGDQIIRFKLMTASGNIISASRTENADVFYSAIGGMGLLGVMVELTLQLKPIPSLFVHVSRHPAPNLSALMAKLRAVKQHSDHAVVWLDSVARGSKFGRGVIHSTRWRAESDDKNLERAIRRCMQRLDSRRAHAATLAPLVGVIVSLMMNFQTLSVGLFNKLYYRYCELRTRLGTADNDESIIRYSFDASFMIPSASAVCGPYGYTMQLTVPDTDAVDAITEMLKVCQRSPCYPAKLIMRLHRQDQHLVSFCEDGYSLNFEFHPKKRQMLRMKQFADELIEIAIAHGGKVHLAKDHILTRNQFQRLYPRYGELREIKRRLDPGELFQSDIYKRLMRDERASAADPGQAEHSKEMSQSASA
ncbi:MAG: FAD-binding oxidoreductase [Gammaproteobacteria bacterium]